EIRSSLPYNFLSFPTPEEEEEAVFKSLLELCISSLIQNKHPLKCVQEYLEMIRKVTIDKKNLDYLNHHETFYICNVTDNRQYWMVVEKESFIVRCENGGLPSSNTLSLLHFFKITHYNIASICLETAKSMM
ncbi:hypothetical protein RFI_34415, partial [Reticulomyxa filosa]